MTYDLGDIDDMCVRIFFRKYIARTLSLDVFLVIIVFNCLPSPSEASSLELRERGPAPCRRSSIRFCLDPMI
jgi:hypothetical protein